MEIVPKANKYRYIGKYSVMILLFFLSNNLLTKRSFWEITNPKKIEITCPTK